MTHETQENQAPLFNRPVLPLNALTLTAAVALAFGGSVYGAGPVVAASSVSTAKSPFIVVLANQHPEVSARAAQRWQVTGHDQAPLVARARSGGAAGIKTFSVINAFAATIDNGVPELFGVPTSANALSSAAKLTAARVTQGEWAAEPTPFGPTVAPTGAPGTTVHAVVYVDTFSSFLVDGDEVAAIPYTYTIK